MGSELSLTVPYEKHRRVERLLDVLTYHLEEIALGFDRWERSRVYGPGMYVALVVGPSIADFADPMGENRWPADGVREPLVDMTGFADAASEVAYSCDGAVVVSVDGVVNRQLVRFRSVEIADDLDYAPWMGSRHMSALDVSTREDVIATLTLSQETGRVTRFQDGNHESIAREELGGPWRAE